MSINKVTVCGNVTRDPELRTTGKGLSVLEIGIAVGERKRVSEDQWEEYSNFFDCIMFGTRAEKLANIIKKGMKLTILGHLHQDRWTDKNTDQNKSAVRIIVEDLELMQKASRTDQAEAASAGLYDGDIPF